MCDPKEDAAVSWKNYDFKEEVLAWANQASKRGVSHYPYSLQVEFWMCFHALPTESRN